MVESISFVHLSPKQLVSEASLLADNQWIGTDFEKSTLKNMHVYGSFINSDADVGSILLKIKKGDILYYRSGPTGGKQTLEILNSKFPPIVMPTFSDWVLLKFDGKNLPIKEFIIKLSDNGSGWGEWSAIALKNEHG